MVERPGMIAGAAAVLRREGSRLLERLANIRMVNRD